MALLRSVGVPCRFHRFTIDKQLQKGAITDFCSYGVATKNFLKSEIYWNENNTYIQKEGINQDLGIFDDPDTFFIDHRQELSKLKKFMYRNLVSSFMNQNVIKIRESII